MFYICVHECHSERIASNKSCPSLLLNTTSALIVQYNDVVMGTIAFQINSLAIFNSTVYSDAYQRKHQSSASLAFMRGIHLGQVKSPHKWTVTRKMFPFHDVIMVLPSYQLQQGSGVTRPSDGIWRQIFWSKLNQVMACCLIGDKQTLTYPKS